MGTVSRSVAPQLTIQDLLANEDLAITAAVLPPGTADRTISWVHPTEQVDPRPHLRKDELVCTLGSALVRPHTATIFVRALSESEVAGVVLGLGEVHVEPPAELKAACESVGVPLLLLDHGVPFLAINDAVMQHRGLREADPHDNEASLLIRLMTLAREGANEQTLLAMASQELGGEMTHRLQANKAVVAWRSDAPEPSAEFMSQFENLLQFRSFEEDRVEFEQRQRIGQLSELITAGLAHPAAILPDIENEGLNPGELQVSFWPTGSESVLSERWKDCLIGTMSREVVLITNASDSADEFAAPGFVCGYSSTVAYTGLRRALTEARTAQRLARKQGGVVGPGELASFETLLEQQPSELLAPFVEQLAGPLLRADEDGRGDLMHTLATFIDVDRHLQSTAERLFVHVNTVRHRLTKVHELTGRDPFSLAGISDLRIAVWAATRHHMLRFRILNPNNR